MQRVSHNIQPDSVPLLVDDATGKEIVKLKQGIIMKKAHSKSMQTKRGAASQEVEETKKALAFAEHEGDISSEQMELAIIELIATNKAWIWMKANSSPTSTFRTNPINLIFNLKIPRLLTHDGSRTLDTITSIRSNLHWHIGPPAKKLGLKDKFGILLTNGWATTALLQFCDKVAIWANHRFRTYTSVGLVWEDFSTEVKKAVIHPNTVKRGNVIESHYKPKVVSVTPLIMNLSECFNTH